MGLVQKNQSTSGRLPLVLVLGYMGGDPVDQCLLGHHRLHLREKLFPFGLLIGGCELVIREAELLAAHQPKSWTVITGLLSREWPGFSIVSLGLRADSIAMTSVAGACFHTTTALTAPMHCGPAAVHWSGKPIDLNLIPKP